MICGFVKWASLLPAWFTINVLAYLGAPMLALIWENREGYCDNGNSYGVGPRLPAWLEWFQTPDNSLLGDAAWTHMEDGHWPWRTHFADWPILQAYLGRLGWLWRNPAYGFERSVLAASISPTDAVSYFGDPQVRDKPNGREGYCYTVIGHYWNLVWIKPFGSESRCLCLNLGWNLKTYAELPSRVTTEPIAQYVVSPRIASFIAT